MVRVGSQELAYLSQVLDNFENGQGHLSGFYKSFLGGPWVQRFEEAFAKYIGTKYAIAVSSGTAALHTALLAALDEKSRAGRFNVLTSPYTFVASASSICMAGETPLFCDIDVNSLNMDPLSFEREDPEPDAIIAVHLLGQPCNLDLIKSRFPKAPIIEDCAQSLGAKYQDRMTGSIGALGCFSFQETKSLTTLGEGGMITTNNERLANYCRAMRNHGEKYIGALYLGYNYRMTEAQAAFGLAQLQRFPETLKEQVACATIVRENLPEGLIPIGKTLGTEPSYFLVGTEVSDPRNIPLRDRFVETAMKALGFNSPLPGATIGPGYKELVVDLPYFRTLNPNWANRFPLARRALRYAVWFDIHRFTDQETVRQRMERLKDLRLDLC